MELLEFWKAYSFYGFPYEVHGVPYIISTLSNRCLITVLLDIFIKIPLNGTFPCPKLRLAPSLRSLRSPGNVTWVVPLNGFIKYIHAYICVGLSSPTKCESQRLSTFIGCLYH